VVSEIFLFLVIACFVLTFLLRIFYSFVEICKGNELDESLVESHFKSINWGFSLLALSLLFYMISVSGDCEKSIMECANEHARLTISNWRKLLHLNAQ
jgi:uncharacterized membrane protein